MDWRRHGLWIAGLLALACVVQVALVRRATVPALDAVGFVETARQIDRHGFAATARSEREPVVFPAWIWVVHEVLTRTRGESRSDWAHSAQLAAAVPLVLAVVPIYLVSVRLFGAAAGLAGTGLFCLLPKAARLGADGIGDGVHLLFFASALAAMVAYLDSAERRNPLWLLAAGAGAALASLVRTEALLLPATLAAVLAAFERSPRLRQGWPRTVRALSCLALGVGMVFAPYLGAVGPATLGEAAQRLLGRYTPTIGSNTTFLGGQPLAPEDAVWRLSDEESMSFGPKDTTVSIRRRGYRAALAQFAEELAAAFGYVIGPFGLLGLYRLRDRLDRPVDRFAQTYCLLFAVAVVCFTANEGYLAARHLLPLVVLGLGAAGYGLLEASRGLARRLRPNCDESAGWVASTASGRFAFPTDWSVVLLAGSVCLAMNLIKPLHAAQLGHRRAAEWLARQPGASAVVLDSRGWTGLYSGRPTLRYGDARAAFAHPQLAYVVIERRELEYDSNRSRTLAHLLEVAAEPLVAWPAAEGGRQQVVVYRWQPERFRRWVARQRSVLALAREESPDARADRRVR
jgi:hypothetical protein